MGLQSLPVVGRVVFNGTKYNCDSYRHTSPAISDLRAVSKLCEEQQHPLHYWQIAADQVLSVSLNAFIQFYFFKFMYSDYEIHQIRYV